MTIRFIAEIGSNHNRSQTRIARLIEAAKRIGCWGVKFQLFKGEKLYAPEFKSQIEKMTKWELDEYHLPFIREKTHELNQKFGCTPFDLEAVDTLVPIVCYLKIGSYEALWTRFIRKVIDASVPWAFSTGMLDDNGIRNIIDMASEAGNLPNCIFHCNSRYPAWPENCNLKAMRGLQLMRSSARGGWSGLGWSDHTVEPGVIHKAVEFGARYIEFHFDLEDGEGFESSVGHCWKPSQIAPVIHDVKIGMAARSSDDSGESSAKKWRTSPADGLRPLQEFRRELLNETDKD